jgi:hypothetical protein
MNKIAAISSIILVAFMFTACDEKVKQNGEEMTAAAKEFAKSALDNAADTAKSKATEAADAAKEKASEAAAAVKQTAKEKAAEAAEAVAKELKE